MTASYPLPGALLTANDAFKDHYRRNLHWSALVALLLTLLFFLFTPRYVPRPYQLIWRPQIICEFEVLQEPTEIVPPPPVLPLPIEPVDDDEVFVQIDVVPNMIPFGGSEVILRPLEPPVADMDFAPSASRPRLIRQVRPDYPELARLAQLEGTVTVNVLVGSQGEVLKAVIAQGVHPVLNRAALAAARQFRFEPGRQRDWAVKAWMAIPFRFRLD